MNSESIDRDVSSVDPTPRRDGVPDDGLVPSPEADACPCLLHAAYDPATDLWTCGLCGTSYRITEEGVSSNTSDACVCDPAKNEVCGYHAYGENADSAPSRDFGPSWCQGCSKDREFVRVGTHLCQSCERHYARILDTEPEYPDLASPTGPEGDPVRPASKGLAPELDLDPELTKGSDVDAGASGFASDVPTEHWLITGHSRQEPTGYWWQFIGPFASQEAAEKARKALPGAEQRITFEMTPMAVLGLADESGAGDKALTAGYFASETTEAPDSTGGVDQAGTASDPKVAPADDSPGVVHGVDAPGSSSSVAAWLVQESGRRGVDARQLVEEILREEGRYQEGWEESEDNMARRKLPFDMEAGKRAVEAGKKLLADDASPARQRRARMSLVDGHSDRDDCFAAEDEVIRLKWAALESPAAECFHRFPVGSSVCDLCGYVLTVECSVPEPGTEPILIEMPGRKLSAEELAKEQSVTPELRERFHRGLQQIQEAERRGREKRAGHDVSDDLVHTPFAHVVLLRRTLGFFSRVIRSGESWTEDCETVYREAREALDSLKASLPSAGKDAKRLAFLEKAVEFWKAEEETWREERQRLLDAGEALYRAMYSHQDWRGSEDADAFDGWAAVRDGSDVEPEADDCDCAQHPLDDAGCCSRCGHPSMLPVSSDEPGAASSEHGRTHGTGSESAEMGQGVEGRHPSADDVGASRFEAGEFMLHRWPDDGRFELHATVSDLGVSGHMRTGTFADIVRALAAHVGTDDPFAALEGHIDSLRGHLTTASADVARLKHERPAPSAEASIQDRADEDQAMYADLTDLWDAVEVAWTLIANAHGGRWEEASQEWTDAAVRWRDERFHPLLKRRPAHTEGMQGGPIPKVRELLPVFQAQRGGITYSR